jgi:hypothetical protein
MPNEILKALAVIAAQLQIQNEIASAGTQMCDIYNGEGEDEIAITSLKSINRLAARFEDVFTGNIDESDFYGYADEMDKCPLTEANFLIERAKRK